MTKSISHLEEVVEQREEHGVVVGEDEEVDREQVGRGLQVAEGVRRLGLAAALDVDLPARLGLLPGQDEEGERARLQLVLVERQVVDDHGLLVGAREGDLGVRRPLGERGRVVVRPEGLGQRPESHRETLLRRPGDVDQAPREHGENVT